MVVRFLLAMVLVCSGLSSQLYSPYNVEVMGQGRAVPIKSYKFRPHLAVAWNPRFGEPVLSLHPTGIPVKLVIRAIYVQHPSWWTGEWNGFTAIPMKMDDPLGLGPAYTFPYGGGSYELLSGLDLDLERPGEWQFGYGYATSGFCCYGMPVVPELVILLMEVQ